MSSYGFHSAADVSYTFDQTVELETTPLKRSGLLSFPFVIPPLFCGISWMAGGIPFLTDIGFTVLLVLCVMGVLFETTAFSRRFGVGGLIVFGGTIVWYCMDYFAKWFNSDFHSGDLGYSAETIAKAAFSTALFVFCCTLGLQLKPWNKVVRWVSNLPEPPSSTTYLLVIIFTLIIGLMPYAFFTRDPLPVTLWKAMTSMRAGGGPQFTEGRTGNLNYSWGGYLAQVIQVGEVGGVLAAFYVLMTPGKGFRKWVATLIWLLWSAMAFGTGSRGDFLFAVLPVSVLLFIKYMMVAAAFLRKFSSRAVIYTGISLFCILVVVQIQGSYRNVGIKYVELSNLEVFKVQGNGMFSEGLLGYASFPDTMDFARDKFPGATYILPIPDVIARFAIGWIPRVLWRDKPGISEVGQWYDKQISGGTANNTTGGTVAPSVAGLAYLNYGIPGVIQMGILFGYLCKLAEAFLWKNLSRPFGMMFSLGFAAYLVRAFRDLTPHDLYPLLIGCVAIYCLIRFVNAFAGAPPQPAWNLETA